MEKPELKKIEAPKYKEIINLKIMLIYVDNNKIDFLDLGEKSFVISLSLKTQGIVLT